MLFALVAFFYLVPVLNRATEGVLGLLVLGSILGIPIYMYLHDNLKDRIWSPGRGLWLLHFALYWVGQLGEQVPYEVVVAGRERIVTGSILCGVPADVYYARLLPMMGGGILIYGLLFILLGFFRGPQLPKGQAKDPPPEAAGAS